MSPSPSSSSPTDASTMAAPRTDAIRGIPRDATAHRLREASPEPLLDRRMEQVERVVADVKILRIHSIRSTATLDVAESPRPQFRLACDTSCNGMYSATTLRSAERERSLSWRLGILSWIAAPPTALGRLGEADDRRRQPTRALFGRSCVGVVCCAAGTGLRRRPSRDRIENPEPAR